MAVAEGTPEERRTSVGVELGTEGAPVLVRWSNWAPRFGSQEDVAYALRTAAGPVLVDPEAPAAGEAGRVRRLVGRPPVATLLTSDRHERDAYAIRERWGTPVWAPAAGLPARGGELAGRPDHAFEDGALLPAASSRCASPGGGRGRRRPCCGRRPAGRGCSSRATCSTGRASRTSPPPTAGAGRRASTPACAGATWRGSPTRPGSAPGYAGCWRRTSTSSAAPTACRSARRPARAPCRPGLPRGRARRGPTPGPGPRSSGSWSSTGPRPSGRGGSRRSPAPDGRDGDPLGNGRGGPLGPGGREAVVKRRGRLGGPAG